MASPSPRLEVGRVTKPHGLRGEVVVVPVTNRAERFAPGSCLDVGERELRVDASRRHQDRWLVHFEGVDDRDAAEALRGAVLTAEPTDAAPGGELWVHELVGCTVVTTDGSAVGVVDAVEANPAHDLLVLDTGALIPMPFVVEHTAGRVVVELPDGLLDLFAG
jgi:16S rRNA processing protein RimM